MRMETEGENDDEQRENEIFSYEITSDRIF